MKAWIYIIAMAIIMAFGAILGTAICCFFIDIIFRIGLSEPPLINYIMMGIGCISFIAYLIYYYYNENKLEDILEKVVTFATIIFIGWLGYNRFFKTDDTPIQQQQGQYNLDDYRKQQADSKKVKEECLQIVGDYLKRYGYNVTYIYTTDPSLNNWQYNVKGTITNSDGTTRHFGVLYDYPTKTIRTFDVD